MNKGLWRWCGLLGWVVAQAAWAGSSSGVPTAAQAATVAPAACRISEQGIGPARLGMTLQAVRAAMPQARFKLRRDGEGVAWVVVTQGRRELLSLYAEDAVRGNTIRWDRRVRHIDTTDPRCATDAGVHPGMRLSEAARRLGGLVALSVSEIESREIARFANQAPNWVFRTDGQGIYAAGQRETTRYAPQAVLYSISVAN